MTLSPDQMCMVGMGICMEEIDERDGWLPDLEVLAARVEGRLLAEYGVRCRVRVEQRGPSITVTVVPIPDAQQVLISYVTDDRPVRWRDRVRRRWRR